MHVKIYSEDNHHIRQETIDQDALNIIMQLKEHGYEAFLVGGSVRDLLMGRTPKDYDISTSCLPDDMKRIFHRRCLLIGKRFRLAHIRFGKKIFEVSTFRSGGNLENTSLIVRDNCWGTAEEDVLRRDFTTNALFYDPTTRCILDYVGGVDDIHNKILRTIGDPISRFKQDPVRMIRLFRFQSRLGFQIEDKTKHALDKCKHDIIKSSPERVLEEILRMLETTYVKKFFELINCANFLEILFPCFHHFFSGKHRKKAFEYLHAIDMIHKENNKQQKEPLDRGCLLAALVYPILEEEIITLAEDRQQPVSFQEILLLADSLLHGIDTSSFAHIPRKLLAQTHFIITSQFRVTPLKGPPKYHSKISRQPGFTHVLDFLELRSYVDKNLKEIFLQWKDHSTH